MSDLDTNTPDSGRNLAAEYVLGLLSATERRDVETRLPSDTVLAAEVVFWETRFGPLANDIHPVTPPSSVWSGVDAAIRRRAAVPASGGLWQSLAFWRAFGVASAGLAAACIAALVVVAQPPAARAPMIASLDATGGATQFMAAIRPDGQSVMLMPAALVSTDSRAMELWIIPPGGRPHSLGMIQAGRSVQVKIPRELAPHMHADAVLAVSLEPPGGSPTGLPTGPVIANGKLTNL